MEGLREALLAAQVRREACAGRELRPLQPPAFFSRFFSPMSGQNGHWRAGVSTAARNKCSLPVLPPISDRITLHVNAGRLLAGANARVGLEKQFRAL